MNVQDHRVNVSATGGEEYRTETEFNSEVSVFNVTFTAQHKVFYFDIWFRCVCVWGSVILKNKIEVYNSSHEDLASAVAFSENKITHFPRGNCGQWTGQSMSGWKQLISNQHTHILLLKCLTEPPHVNSTWGNQWGLLLRRHLINILACWTTPRHKSANLLSVVNRDRSRKLMEKQRNS